MAGRYGIIKSTNKVFVVDVITPVFTGVNNGKYVVINGKKRYLSQVSNWHDDLWEKCPDFIKKTIA